LHPYWGSNRTFSKANSELPIPVPVPYSTEWNSEYNTLFLAVYAKSKNLSNDERQIAAWWSDDPTESFSPPGHSYNKGSIAIRTDKTNLMIAAETYARVGMAIADAFINCFKCKYKYYAERPSTYIRKGIDPTWVQYWPEPPFPAFSSGHATQGAAAATVLANIYGDQFEFTDNSHEGRARDTSQKVDFIPRKFHSFIQAADESALSRFLGGIHTQQDNTVGYMEGRKIGWNINGFKWRK
jgi:membrane-associated phospholipid phosphatase